MQRPRRLAWPRAVLLLACGHLADPGFAETGRVSSLLELRQQGVVMQQWDQSCAAAALATVLRHGLGDSVDERQVAEGMLAFTTPDAVADRGGFSMLEMKRYAEGRGFSVTARGGMGLHQLAGMGLAIVPLTVQRGALHFVVVTAVDAHAVHLADPTFGRTRMARPAFERRWHGGVAMAVRAP